VLYRLLLSAETRALPGRTELKHPGTRQFNFQTDAEFPGLCPRSTTGKICPPKVPSSPTAANNQPLSDRAFLAPISQRCSALGRPSRFALYLRIPTYLLELLRYGMAEFGRGFPRWTVLPFGEVRLPNFTGHPAIVSDV
jgi:hypothetical protein